MKRAIAIAAAAAAAFGLAAWALTRPPGPDAVADRYMEALARADWATLYGLSPSVEKAMNGWSPAQFAAVLEAVRPADLSPVSAIRLARMDLASRPDMALGSPRWQRRFKVRLQGVPPDERGVPAEFILTVSRGPDGRWYAFTDAAVWLLNRLRSNDSLDRAERLARGLESAGLQGIVLPQPNVRVTVDGLRRYAAGDVEFRSIVEHVSG